MLKKIILILLILQNVFVFAEDIIEIGSKKLVQRVPGIYRSFRHINPQGLVLLDPEGINEPEPFDHRNDFILWIYNSFLADTGLISGISMDWGIGRLNANESYLETVEGNEFYDYYRNTILKELMGITGSWFYDYKIGKNLWLQPEFKYHHYQSLLESGSFPFDNLAQSYKGNILEIEVDMHYISLPILLRYRVTGDKYSSIYLLFGPGLNLFIYGNAYWKYYYYLENGSERNHYSGQLELEKIKNATISLNTSIGYSYHRLFIELRVEHCMSSINNLTSWQYLESENERVREFLLNAYDYEQYSFSLNLGYRVGRSWYLRD